MKTTLLGLGAAVGLVLQTHLQAGGSLFDWKTWLPAVLVAGVGYFAKDHTSTTK